MPSAHPAAQNATNTANTKPAWNQRPHVPALSAYAYKKASSLVLAGVAGACGYDPARRVVGRKRHALVDTDGRLLGASVSPASLHDSHAGIGLLRASREP